VRERGILRRLLTRDCSIFVYIVEDGMVVILAGLRPSEEDRKVWALEILRKDAETPLPEHYMAGSTCKNCNKIN